MEKLLSESALYSKRKNDLAARGIVLDYTIQKIDEPCLNYTISTLYSSSDGNASVVQHDGWYAIDLQQKKIRNLLP